MDRDTKGKFVKGNKASIGVGGRPKGLSERARAATNDGADIIAFFLKVAQDENGKIEHRLEAWAWLADRGWGKAAQFINVDATGEIRVYTGLDVEKV